MSAASHSGRDETTVPVRYPAYMFRYLMVLRGALLLIGAAAAQAQLLPQLPLPSLPRLPAVQAPPSVVPALREVRNLRVRELLRRHPRELDRDPRGHPIVRGVFLALSPSDAALQAARAAGFQVQAEQALDGLGGRVVTLLGPRGWGARRALGRLRQLDPQGSYDFNHVYVESGVAGDARADPVAPAPPRSAAVSGGAGGSAAGWRVGLVDSGVATAHPSLRDSTVHTHGCGGAAFPAAHGTAVASLLVGAHDTFRGAAPGAQLYAADVYCGSELGGQVDAVVQALAWLAREQVPVVNVSLVGPANVVLEAVVRTLLARGTLVVAAVGNDGPAARPLYPASYAGVIGVTAVDARDKVLLEAGRGPQVDFAAPGADISAAAPAGHYAMVRGTSFAAPLVAGSLARGRSLAALTAGALDLGARGPDKVFGAGLVAGELRASLRLIK